ncbi:hypothetical protein P7K49_014489 [Saguinus oedipus]|uniref:Uncharacterized protein n=1 Tax=Saguinus oedipus TaxID=9490 RepID=A0ABQ9VIY8_SAGOE|nr:hypothetical protein P7K49_014489 [Saguinus oedipus]
MLQTLKELKAPSSEPRAAAFQHLLLLMGIYFFKFSSHNMGGSYRGCWSYVARVYGSLTYPSDLLAVVSPTESCDLLGDIQTCIRKSLGERCHGSRTKAIGYILGHERDWSGTVRPTVPCLGSKPPLADPQEPPWVEVLVEILLALLAQPRHLMCQVAQSMFSHICSHMILRALQLILDVLNPETSEDEVDHVVVMDKSDKQWLKAAEVLPAQARWGGRSGKITEGGEESEDEEELGDEAMMALDQNLTSIFAEQKLWIQAQQDEKSKPQKEKVLQCNFQIWLQVLDLVEVLVTKQPENVLVLELLEPLLGII